MTSEVGRVKHVLSRAAALILGVLWGFFVAFNVVFSDVFGVMSMIAAVALVYGAYAVLGAVFGLVEPPYGWRWALWIAPPGVLLVLWQLADAPERWLYHLAVAGAAAVGSALTASVTGRIRRVK